ncbi:MAG: cell envelope biogenesis protein OmpA, partial [Treponema sp.]|nr:cell envelope biogenesis protein OmpA [Treponema sp.]
MLKMNSVKKRVFSPKTPVLLAAVFLLAGGLLSAEPAKSPQGADAVPDLYAPHLAGSGGFTTTTGGAPVSALNPAQAGDARRIIIDAGYLAIPGLGDEKGYLHSIGGGALFPTRYGVFGASLRYIGRPFDMGPDFESFPIDRTFSGNVFAAKEVYSGMSLGAGLNFGAGADWTLSGDLGFRYNTGRLGPFDNFTWTAVLRDMGKSYHPTWLTAAGGVSFDLLHVYGKEGKKDPFVVNFAGDLSLPSLFYPLDINMIIKLGLDITIAETITISTSWPGGSGLNARELAENNVEFPAIPSVGLGVNILLPTGGKRIAGGRLPADGDLKIDAAYKPLYNGITAIGGGATWFVGVPDKKPPVIRVDYTETTYFSPNHDGNADYLEFPVLITDDKYVAGWVMEVRDAEGNVVRTIRNKEQRPDSKSVKDFFSRLFAVKKQVEVPPLFKWDGICDSGDLAPDGKYYFTITAVDDSQNTAESPAYETVLKNAPPVISIAAMSGIQLIFNPRDGGSGKGSITFNLNGSEEDAWMGGIWDADGQQIRKFESISGEPETQVWDGRNDSGEIAPDGVYSYRIG